MADLDRLNSARFTEYINGPDIPDDERQQIVFLRDICNKIINGKPLEEQHFEKLEDYGILNGPDIERMRDKDFVGIVNTLLTTEPLCSALNNCPED
ncbi:hypothetical protein R5R35_007510 [Gryllus longicercus]|uniref:Uncharacterized protein n=1 Tax=Gryllus longicercus TaxID=2509291 RepID=A0AAN9YZD5_9ORTH